MPSLKKLLLSVAVLAMSLQAEEIYATFNVEAAQHANLAFTSSGTVEQVNVDVASVVKKGISLSS